MRGNSNCYTCWAVIFNHLLACMGIKTAEKNLDPLSHKRTLQY